MKEELLKIINHYGINNQQRKLEEEVFELQEAIIKYENNCNLTRESIKEEIADVSVLLQQISEYYDISFEDIYPIMKNKINRTMGRMKK